MLLHPDLDITALTDGRVMLTLTLDAGEAQAVLTALARAQQCGVVAPASGNDTPQPGQCTCATTRPPLLRAASAPVVVQATQENQPVVSTAHQYGPHEYPLPHPAYCAYGCGARKGMRGYISPPGVDPQGVCPNNPLLAGEDASAHPAPPAPETVLQRLRRLADERGEPWSADDEAAMRAALAQHTIDPDVPAPSLWPVVELHGLGAR